ncbi:hypothetical protein [Peribacillus sp. V2I11]|nr:hypothetical protein [Peribacillus sp. V2I11]MDQ0881481.1 hypothetical protein [Peribacillus sp. V2I11]
MNRTMMTATNTLNQLQSKIDQLSNNCECGHDCLQKDPNEFQ